MLVGYTKRRFANKIKGRKILDLQRKGKLLIFKLSGGVALVLHLRLTGQIFIRRPSDPPDRFNHAIISLGRNLELRFNDLRKFGQMWLLPQKEVLKNFDQIQKLGPDPLQKSFTFERFKQIITKRPTKIKALLLDQAKISGIGNIYSDEALFQAKIHPETPANKIPDQKTKKLYLAVRKVLQEAIRYRGTSDQWYREAHGRKGRYQLRLKVYHRSGQACPRCRRKIKRVKIGGRSAHFCPQCQNKSKIKDQNEK